jgi:ribonuclease HI
LLVGKIKRLDKETIMKKVVLYTDGACSYNPGPGGWGAILIYKKNQKELSGGEQNTTNNQMELLAIIKGLEALREPCIVNVFSDSAYVVNAFEKEWIENWIKNSWKTANKKDVANRELWQKLLELMKIHKVKFHKVKGHSQDKLNNRCDELARNEVEKFTKPLIE